VSLQLVEENSKKESYIDNNGSSKKMAAANFGHSTQGYWNMAATTNGYYATILPAVAFMIILYFGAQAVGHNPIALVVQDNGPHAQELVNILNESDAFKVSMITSKSEAAEQALKHIQVAAVITIPSNFDIAYNAHKADPVTIRINNLNLDFTNDLRRSLPAAISEFYSLNQKKSKQ
jgi:ABC-2 type transport system permease protein